MRSFGSNIDLRKQDFLSQEKINDRSRVLTNVNNESFHFFIPLSLYSELILIELTLRDVIVYKFHLFFPDLKSLVFSSRW